MGKPYDYRTITGSDGRWYVEGPGSGFSYDSGTLYPHMRFASQASSIAAAHCCNEAYRQGYAKAQRDIKQALGLKEAL